MAANLAIRRLSARTPARAQPVAARLALQTLGADLEDALPRSLPPQSLLWLRRLQLQAPEAALLRPAPAAWRQDWIAAGRDRLDAALAQAARPALGPVPDSAPAVLFADAAEMLACLALAAQGGQLDRWWWRGLLGRAWPQWQTAWAARPEAQVGARRLLERAGQGGAAAGWAQAPPSERLPAVAAAADLGAAAVASTLQVAAVVESASGARPTRQSPEVRLAHVLAASPEPLRPLVAARPRGVAPGVSVPAPEDRASWRPGEKPALPAAAVQAASGTPAPQRAGSARPVHPEEGRASGPPLLAVPAAAPPAAGAVMARDSPECAAPMRLAARVSEASVRGVEPAPAPGRPVPDAAAAASIRREPAAPIAPATVEPTAGNYAEPATRPPSAEGALPAPASLDPFEPAISSVAAWPWPQAVLSHQAPLLFIVNALLEDGLYPDFTRPRDPGLPVPLWALLPALAAAWRLPADGLQAALRQRCPGWHAPEAMPAAPGAPAGPWPAWLAAYARCLRRRLCRRLGLRPAGWPQALTLARPARLWISEGEWVAEFDLNAHDVSWRLAGLDRDPGWLPSAGCTLRFSFT